MKYLEIHGLYRRHVCNVCHELAQCKQISFVESYMNGEEKFQEIEICADCMLGSIALAKAVKEIGRL